MISLHKLLQIEKGLPPDSLHHMLFSRKLAGKSGNFLKMTATGYPCILENSAGKNAVNYSIYGNSLQNGTPSPENPVDVESVGELVTEGEFSGKFKIPVTTNCKNLLNDDGWEQGQYANGIWQYNSRRVTSGWIKVNGGQIYTLSLNDSSNTASFININYFDKNMQWLGNRTNLGIDTFSATAQTLTLPPLPDNSRYLRVVIRPYNDTNELLSVQTAKTLKVQVELGDTATEYQPYQEPVTTDIYLDNSLKKIDDYSDMVNYSDRTLTRKIIRVNLTSDLNWVKVEVNPNNYAQFRTASTYKFLKSQRKNALSNRLRVTDEDFDKTSVPSINLYNDTYNIFLNNSEISTIEELKTWLDKNPTYVEYILETPETKAAILPELPTFKGTVTVTADTEIPPSDMEITYKSRK